MRLSPCVDVVVTRQGEVTLVQCSSSAEHQGVGMTDKGENTREQRLSIYLRLTTR